MGAGGCGVASELEYCNHAVGIRQSQCSHSETRVYRDHKSVQSLRALPSAPRPAPHPTRDRTGAEPSGSVETIYFSYRFNMLKAKSLRYIATRHSFLTTLSVLRFFVPECAVRSRATRRAQAYSTVVYRISLRRYRRRLTALFLSAASDLFPRRAVAVSAPLLYSCRCCITSCYETR